MSQENVERIRVVVEDFLAGRSQFATDGTLTKIAGEEFLHPEIEWDASEARVLDLGGVYYGVEGVRQWWAQWLAAWDVVDFDYELIDAGERVVLLLDQRMRGRSTGIEVTLGKYAHVFTLRDGQIVHWKVYMQQSQALQAAGLRE